MDEQLPQQAEAASPPRGAAAPDAGGQSVATQDDFDWFAAFMPSASSHHDNSQPPAPHGSPPVANTADAQVRRYFGLPGPSNRQTEPVDDAKPEGAEQQPPPAPAGMGNVAERTDFDHMDQDVPAHRSRNFEPHVATVVSKERLDFLVSQVVGNFRQLVCDVEPSEAVDRLRASRWDCDAAVLAYYGDDSGKSRIGRSGGHWRRLTGQQTCATCFETKDADHERVHSTDCGVALCATCWKGFFKAELSGGVRGTLRCPFPSCTSIVPDWLIQVCLEDVVDGDEGMAEALLVAYRDDLRTDFVSASSRLCYCPHPRCDKVLELAKRPRGFNGTCNSSCGHRFCFHCLREPHYPADCETARKVIQLDSVSEVQRIAMTLKGVRRCGSCGMLLQNDGGCGTLKCGMCGESQVWAALEDCEQNVEKAVALGLSESATAEVRSIIFDARGWNFNFKTTDFEKAIKRDAQLAVELVAWAKMKSVIEGPRDWQWELLNTTICLMQNWHSYSVEQLKMHLAILLPRLQEMFDKALGITSGSG